MMLSFRSAGGGVCKILTGFAGPASTMSRLDATVGMVFFMLPVVQMKVLMMWFYWTLMIEGVKVFQKFRNHMHWTGRQCRMWLGDGDAKLDIVMWWSYTVLLVVPPLLYSFLAFIFSGAFIFSLTTTGFFVVPTVSLEPGQGYWLFVNMSKFVGVNLRQHRHYLNTRMGIHELINLL